MFGALDAGAPMENLLRSLRNAVRQQDASGGIMIVGIDEPTVEALQEWPLRRRNYAELIDRLNRMGVRRIFLSMSFAMPSQPADDRMLADAIARSRSKVLLPTWFMVDPVTGHRTESLPMALLRPHAGIANINVRSDNVGLVRRLPMAIRIADHAYPSFAAELAHVRGVADATFPIDYSIRLSSIPVVSGIGVLRGQVAAATMKGRDVVIGITSTRLDNSYYAPTAGRISGVYLHVLGAETLRGGIPFEPTWLAPFALAAIVIFGLSGVRRRAAVIVVYGLAVVLTLVVPFVLDTELIFVDVVPTLVLLATSAIWRCWAAYRRSYRARGIVNLVSGLPNLNALRAIANVADVALVAARVRNFPEVTASLPADQERALVDQIARRLSLGSGGATIYQGDDGIFAWLMPNETVAFTSDQFDALNALFRNAVAVGDRHVDLAITFGLAADSGLSPFNRLGGALMAADAAAEAGLHWKLHEAVEARDSSWKLSLLTRLDAAIDAGEVWVAYQPKIALRTRAVVGAEALVRWTHPDRGPISPIDFIPIAEQQNRIDKLTYHVLETAIRAAAIINTHGIVFGMAVNLSVRLLEDPDLVERVAALLTRHGLAAQHLTLEITETAALSGNQRSIAVLDELRRIGVLLSIDDYGTGFSNLENLRTIPATEIKIDRSFIDAIDHSRSDAVMVRSTIQMAHSLGQTVVAEGVERAETLQTLQAMHCDQVQGYLTGRPMNFASLSRVLIRDRRKWAA